MEKSNYTLTTEQKRILDKIAMDLEGEIEDRCMDHEILNVYDTPDGRIDDNKFTAILWYVGDMLSCS
jgi:hypothetical protein